jgi:hypothetical protein
MGSIETVSVSVNGVPSTGAVLASRGVTQGELLRQEQRAGVVPLNQLVRQAQHQQHQQQQAQAQGGGGSSDSPDEQGGPSDGDAAMGGEQQEDDEVPHARGPSEIDDVDTGPQPGSGGATSYAVGSAAGSGQVVKMQGIDVEAAVGRKADPARQGTPERGPSPGEEMVPRSPKREAEQELDDGGGKKVKVGDEGDGDVVMEAEGSGGDVVGGEGAKPEVEKDAEGDVVIRDPDPLPAEGGEPGQGAEKA